MTSPEATSRVKAAVCTRELSFRREAAEGPARMPPKEKDMSSKAKGKRPAHAVDPADTAKIMVPIKRLRSQMGSSATAKKTLEELGIKGVHKEVRGMARREVRENIEHICLQAVATIMKGEGFSYTMPARTTSNHLYVPELDRLVLKDKMLTRVFANASSARKTAITTRIFQLVLELCGKGIHVTKRDLFYTDVKLFKQQATRLPQPAQPCHTLPHPATPCHSLHSLLTLHIMHSRPAPSLHSPCTLTPAPSLLQTESDDVLDDVACMVRCTLGLG